MLVLGPYINFQTWSYQANTYRMYTDMLAGYHGLFFILYFRYEHDLAIASAYGKLG